MPPNEQPSPVPNASRPIWDLVVEDMQKRDQVGRECYGTLLQAHNGRDALRDAYEEALDMVVYLRQAMEEKRPHLFQAGKFKLASGRESNWKIECDALTKADWEGLALMLLDHVQPFSQVFGVPTGGYPLAEAMKPLCVSSLQSFGSVLVVDDVWTTGGSMKRFIDKLVDIDCRVHSRVVIQRAVIFARNPVPPGVVALFQMPGEKV